MKKSEKIVLVTGGSRGIGKAICQDLHRRGCNVIFTYKSSDEAAQDLVSELSKGDHNNFIVSHKCDMADLQAVTDLVNNLKKEYEKIDVLINNAGRLGDTRQFVMANNDNWFETLRSNVACATNPCKRIIPLMIRNKGGRIINVTSIAARLGNPGQSAYAASKAAIIAFSKSVFREVSPLGITINCVSPSLVETDMTKGLNKRYVEELLKIPLKRMATSEEVAQTVSFLALDAPEYLLGQDIVLDGGLGI